MAKHKYFPGLAIMELFEERDHFIVQAGDYALWCNRFDGSLTAKRGKDVCVFFLQTVRFLFPIKG